MKSLHCYLLVAVFGLSAIFAPNALAGALPIPGIGVAVRKNPGKTAARQLATVNADGSITVKLDGPGDYTITYAGGPLKGQVIKTVKTTRAESVSCKIDARYMQRESKKTE